MTVRTLRWVLLALLGCVLAKCTVSEPITIGASTEWSDGRYRFSGGTEPGALGFAILTLIGLILLMNAKPAAAKAPLAGLVRRFAAFWLDFMFAMFMLTPVVGLLPTLVEWMRTGSFAWSFERSYQTSVDVPLTVLSIILLLPGLLVYYALPLFLRKPSPGACIAGYQVIADDGVLLSIRVALLRSIVGYFALCAAPVAPFVRRDKTAGKFWLDRVFGTHAVLLN